MSAINVSLHPVAQRRGAASATDVAYTLPAEAAPAAAVAQPPPARGAPTRASEPNVHAPASAAARAPGDGRASDPGPSASFAPASAPFPRPTPLEGLGSHPHLMREQEHPSWGLLHSALDVYPPICVPSTVHPEPAQSATPTHPASRRSSPVATPPKRSRHLPKRSHASLAPPVTLSDEDRTPVRRMTAEQFADMYARYASLDVPHAVVFPFLHGVDGDNVPQNLFFGAPVSGMPTPNYRGLTIVRADMPRPGDHIYASSTSSPWGASKRPSSVSPSASSPGLVDPVSSPGSPSSMSATDPCMEGRPSTSSAPRASCDAESIESSTSALPRSSLSSQPSSLGLTGSVADVESSAATSVYGWEEDQCPSKVDGMGVAGDRTQTMDATAAPVDPQPGHSILASTLFPSDLLMLPSAPGAGAAGPMAHPSVTGPSFIRPRQAAGVSLRNFRIQAVKYATISDIVIYSPAGLHDGVLEMAACFRHAQEELYQERLVRGLGSLRYNVFVVEDPFYVFERRYPELVAVNSEGKSTNRVDFVDGEREEMEILTRASQLDTNVWIGSNGDLPAPEVDMPSSDWINVDAAPRTNPNNYAVCIEAHEAGETPRMDKLQGAAQYMDSLQMAYHATHHPADLTSSAPDAAWTASEGPTGAAGGSFGLSLGPRGWSTSPSSTHALASTEAYSPPSARVTGAALAPVPVPLASIVLMECAVTASDKALVEPGVAQHFADQMIELAIWIKEQADPSAFPHRAGRHLPRKVLIHCADGYTETSLLALTYIMYTHPGMRLPEAYLFLQNDLQRSFFVYPREVPMLQLIEARLMTHKWPKLLTPPFNPHQALSSPSLSKLGESSSRPSEGPIRHSWFYDGLFEGSFPSRILDFLYLGNLNQAMNAGMLRALGITHVVSVGESALSMPPGMESTTPFAAGQGPGARDDGRSVFPTGAGRGWPSNSLRAELEAGRISVLNVQGVADDGIDPLRSTMKQAVEYIESARRAGGKVLVHCRVGVSRSSTIVLAYVMAHLDLSLTEAYLLVRSRRLNILIQPHLLFFWELRGWESYLSRQRVRQLAAQCQEDDDLMDLDEEFAIDPWVALTRAHERTHTQSLAPFAPDELETRLTVLPECQQYRREIKSVSRMAERDGVLLARPSATGKAVLEQVHTLDEEDPLDCDLGVGTSSIRANLPAPIPMSASFTSPAASPSSMERAGTVVAGLPAAASCTKSPKTMCPPCSCGYGHASVGHGSSRGANPRALRLAWGSFAQEVAHLNERYFV